MAGGGWRGDILSKRKSGVGKILRNKIKRFFMLAILVIPFSIACILETIWTWEQNHCKRCMVRLVHLNFEFCNHCLREM